MWFLLRIYAFMHSNTNGNDHQSMIVGIMYVCTKLYNTLLWCTGKLKEAEHLYFPQGISLCGNSCPAKEMWHDIIAIVVEMQTTADESTTVTTSTHPGS